MGHEKGKKCSIPEIKPRKILADISSKKSARLKVFVKGNLFKIFSSATWKALEGMFKGTLFKRC